VPLIISSAVARHVSEKATPLGERTLRGLREPQALFTLSSLRNDV
jgi:class 3 adenylate cyclase